MKSLMSLLKVAGRAARVDGLERVQRGWLTEEVVVQLKVVGAGLRLWEERGGSYWLKVTLLACSLLR